VSDISDQIVTFTEGPDGTLIGEGMAARPKIIEWGPTGPKARELVEAEELTRPEWLEQLRRVPVTLGFPADLMVSLENVAEYAIGDIEAVTPEADGAIRVRCRIRRVDAIASIRADGGYYALGYTTQIDETPGVRPDLATETNPTGDYEVRQFGRVPNHLAILVPVEAPAQD
jgi:hypothetical protein